VPELELVVDVVVVFEVVVEVELVEVELVELELVVEVEVPAQVTAGDVAVGSDVCWHACAAKGTTATEAHPRREVAIVARAANRVMRRKLCMLYSR
jgi:hypothetical protein